MPELTLLIQELVLPAHLFSLCFFISYFLVQHVITLLTLSYFPIVLCSCPATPNASSQISLPPSAPAPRLFNLTCDFQSLSAPLHPHSFGWNPESSQHPDPFPTFHFFPLNTESFYNNSSSNSACLPEHCFSSLFLLELQLMLSSPFFLWKSTHCPHSRQVCKYEGSVSDAVNLDWMHEVETCQQKKSPQRQWIRSDQALFIPTANQVE